ncbi:anthrax toxin-like adenylyl cyclase domain-containing protein [Accumulibacter sp.]|uniref:anthrax toxin-like adenylyl cyclase domain-containing protein n=1 Tax=Accumulibacter sp. TaxID=2053492 RepID=UPI00260670F8|nr:anthrax toxin-like adenylyl cyclase domain-containing protein [Accumulibacter sp.]
MSQGSSWMLRQQARAQLVFEQYFDKNDLAAEGFPAVVAQGFLNTAAELDAAIASRCPGKPATQLIDDGHDLKSFYVHAKSCDWGPMAGFVCQLPALNKKGPGNAEFNLDEQVKSIGKYRHLVDAAVARAASGTSREDAAAKEGLLEWPFVPIAISRKALDRLFADGYLDQAYCQGYTKANASAAAQILGCCWSSKSRNVLVEFIARPLPAPPAPDGGWWAIYHRQVWVKNGKTKVFEPYITFDARAERLTLAQSDPEKQLDQLTVWARDAITLSSADTAQLDSFRKVWANHQEKVRFADTSSATDKAYPICGAHNPYPPYPAGDPRNAVSGDYDLFAVWPRTPESRWQETVRLSESRSPADLFVPPFLPPLFRPVRKRHFTVELSNAPGIRLEVIPGFAEIAAWEDAVLGNISDAVGLAAGVLNSCITHLYQRKGRQAPNAAFHSDEGGRPGVNEIDYPVAVFLPGALRKDVAKGAVIVRRHADFLNLLEQLNGRCELPLNFGWMMHLLADLAPADQLQAALASKASESETGKKVAKYLNDRIEAQEKLKDELPDLRRRAAALLTGRADALDKPETLAAFDAAVTTFIDVACLSIDPAARAVAMVKRILEGEPAA